MNKNLYYNIEKEGPICPIRKQIFNSDDLGLHKLEFKKKSILSLICFLMCLSVQLKLNI